MIRFLDNFFDSYEKRMVFLEFLLVLCLIVLCSRNYILGINLTHFDSGADLFSLIQLKDSTNTFFGRFLEGALNSDLSLRALINSFLNSFSFYEIAWLFLLVCFWFERDKNKTLKRARTAVSVYSGFYLILCILTVLLGIYAYSALSTMQAVERLRMIGIILSSGSIALILIMLAACFLQMIQVFSNRV